jgi:hypothetical protein
MTQLPTKRIKINNHGRGEKEEEEGPCYWPLTERKEPTLEISRY